MFAKIGKSELAWLNLWQAEKAINQICSLVLGVSVNINGFIIENLGLPWNMFEIL